MQRYRIEVGHDHEVKPAQIVGAIANEAGIDARYIGQIDIHDDHSYVDLPQGMPRELFRLLKKAWVSGRQLKITKVKKQPYNSQSELRSRSGKSAAERRAPRKKPGRKPAGSGKNRA